MCLKNSCFIMDYFCISTVSLLWFGIEFLVCSSSWITLSGPGRGNSSTLMIKQEERNLIEETNSAVTASTHIPEEEDFFEKSICSTCEHITNTSSTERTQEQEHAQIVWTYNDTVKNETCNSYEIQKWVNKSSVAGGITWQLEKENKMNLQVKLHHSIFNYLPEYSVIKMRLLNEEKQKHHEYNYPKNVTNGPIIEIITQLREIKLYNQSAVQIKFNRSDYHLQINNNWICVYWSRKDEEWKNDGLTTTGDEQFLICISTHLTAFSVLLDPYFLLHSESTEQLDESALSGIISLIGSLLTIPCLLLTIGIYCRKKKESIGETKKILIHECFALLLTHVSYHIYYWFGQLINCLLVNFMTHYFVASFLLWTACDGINMWRILLSDIFNTRGHVFYHGYKILSWGIPILTTSIGLFMFKYNSDKCELHFDRSCETILYIVPCTLILTCNLFLFIWMVVNIICKDSLGRLKNKKIKYVMTLTQVFSITWCVAFPMLWHDSTRLIGQYLFAVLVSTQGVLIFIIRCIHDTEFKQMVRYVCTRSSSTLFSRICMNKNSRLHLFSRSQSKSTSTETQKFQLRSSESTASVVVQ